jgi:hypothetical protein
MDPPLNPPVRLQPISAIPISSRAAQKAIETFLDDVQARTTAGQGGHGAVTVQLQKLGDALKEERRAKKKENS